MMSSRASTAGLLWNLMLAILSFAVPKHRRLVVFGCGGNLYKGNPRYLYEYACAQHNTRQDSKQDSEIDPLWITENSLVYQQLSEKGMPVVWKKSIQGFLAILRARLLVIDFTMRDISYAGTLLGRFRILQTWHGIPLKRIALDQLNFHQENFSNTVVKRVFFNLKKYASRHEYARYKAIICGSETEQAILQSAFGNSQVYVTGFPRNDMLLRSSGAEQRQQLGIDSGTRVILYAPTFRDLEAELQPFSGAAVVAMETILEEQNALILVKRHPHDTRTSFLTGYRILDVTHNVGDIQDILPAVDILITDYSSVFFDFLLTNRPVILYPYDFEFYMKQCRDFYFSYNDIAPGDIAYDENQLLEQLQQQLSANANVNASSNDRPSAYYRVKTRLHRFRDDQSCKRVCNLITELL